MILVDTGPLVALCDAHDRKHRVAVKDLASFAGAEFAICDAVLTEVCFHLRHLNQRRRLGGLLHELGMRPVPVENDTSLWSEILEWLAKYADHEPDWTDACLAVLSGHDEDLEVWTYDREFRTTWRRPNGTAIPLAVRMTAR